YWASLRIEPDLISQIKEAQKEDSEIWTIIENLDKKDEISMDFVTGLPRTQRRHDTIWVVMDRLTKSVHFLPIRKDYSVSRLAEIFQQEIVRLHGTDFRPLSMDIFLHDTVVSLSCHRVIGWCVPDTPSHRADPSTHVTIRGLPSTAC
nr:retrotransposon protein, putative, Ty3-gypsy subclass [Tanacetum cinerariifolium]